MFLTYFPKKQMPKIRERLVYSTILMHDCQVMANAPEFAFGIKFENNMPKKLKTIQQIIICEIEKYCDCGK